MLLQANEDYLTRSQGRVTIYAVYPEIDRAHGAIWNTPPGLKKAVPFLLNSWRLTGVHPHFSSFDILEVWRDKHPAEDWEEGTIVEVSHTEKNWILHRFAFYDKDTQQYLVFPVDGKGSPFPVPFCRLPEPWGVAKPLKCPECGSTDIATASWLAKDGSAWSQDECFSCKKVFAVRPPSLKKIGFKMV